MTENTTSYSEARARLEDIVAEVRKKDVSLEKSLDLLEEASRLASRCTELIDQADPVEMDSQAQRDGAVDEGAAQEVVVAGNDDSAADDVAAVIDADSEDVASEETPDS